MLVVVNVLNHLLDGPNARICRVCLLGEQSRKSEIYNLAILSFLLFLSYLWPKSRFFKGIYCETPRLYSCVGQPLGNRPEPSYNNFKVMNFTTNNFTNITNDKMCSIQELLNYFMQTYKCFFYFFIHV